jgi:hypothetical protein
MKRVPFFGVAVAALFLVLVSCPLSPAGEKPDRGTKNTVKLRSAGKDNVEIEVTSDQRFPIVNAAVGLYIGEQKSLQSRSPNGETTTLIFTMSAADFAKTKNGDRIVVKYDPDSQGHWDFGKLDKSRLDK